MGDLKKPDIRAGAEAFKIVKDAIVQGLGNNSAFIHSLRMELDKYFHTLNHRKASRKTFKRRGC